MADLRWIEVFLFLTLITLTAGAILPYEPDPVISHTVRSGKEVTLPCVRIKLTPGSCEATGWTFAETLLLVTKGVVIADWKMVEVAKTDRMSLTEKCSLVIKKVTKDDAGRYTCRQSPQFQEVINLAVVTMAEHKSHDKVTLSCSVAPVQGCQHKVKWQFRDKDVAMDDNDFRTSESNCVANVTFQTSLFIYTPKNYELLKCRVNEFNHKVNQLFSPQFSGGTTEAVSALGYVMLAMRVAQILLLTVITVLLLKYRGNQRPPDDSTVHHDGNRRGGTVTYENVGDLSVSVSPIISP